MADRPVFAFDGSFLDLAHSYDRCLDPTFSAMAPPPADPPAAETNGGREGTCSRTRLATRESSNGSTSGQHLWFLRQKSIEQNQNHQGDGENPLRSTSLSSGRFSLRSLTSVGLMNSLDSIKSEYSIDSFKSDFSFFRDIFPFPSTATHPDTHASSEPPNVPLPTPVVAKSNWIASNDDVVINRTPPAMSVPTPVDAKSNSIASNNDDMNRTRPAAMSSTAQPVQHEPTPSSSFKPITTTTKCSSKKSKRRGATAAAKVKAVSKPNKKAIRKVPPRAQTIVGGTVGSSISSTSTAACHKKRVRRKEPIVRTYVTVKDTDVLLGRGGKSNHHEGNKGYRNLILGLQPKYKLLEREEKTKMSERVVDWVYKNNGRFLKQEGSRGSPWYVVTKETARLKVSQA
eukprot:scaffold4979_cov73-Cylindrotheca_fusiformis.AAC.11